MKRMQDYPMVLVDAWAMHEALRRLGFNADDIFVHVALNGEDPTGGPWIFVVLHTQDKEFTITVDALRALSPERAMTLWHEFCAKWNAHEWADSEAQRVYDARFLQRPPGAARLAAGLLAKGFVFPRHTN